MYLILKTEALFVMRWSTGSGLTVLRVPKSVCYEKGLLYKGEPVPSSTMACVGCIHVTPELLGAVLPF